MAATVDFEEGVMDFETYNAYATTAMKHKPLSNHDCACGWKNLSSQSEENRIVSHRYHFARAIVIAAEKEWKNAVQ